jgi:hypothetical protein
MNYRILCLVFPLAFIAVAVPAQAQFGCATSTISYPYHCIVSDPNGMTLCEEYDTQSIPQGGQGPVGVYTTTDYCCGTYPYPVTEFTGSCQLAKLHIAPKILETLDKNLRQHGQHLLLADCAGDYLPFTAPTISTATPAELNFAKRLARMARR